MEQEKRYIDKEKKYLAEPNISKGMRIYFAGCMLISVLAAMYFIKKPGNNISQEAC